jgi:hypothetical protein
MSSSNLKHIFIEGRRVTFDRRDDSVMVFPDEGFHFNGARVIGRARGEGRDWEATAPSGETARVEGRKAAAEWLLERTADERADLDLRERAERSAEAEAIEEAMVLLREVRPEAARPRPVLGDDGGRAFFIFGPAEFRDILRDLKSNQ